MDYITVNGIKFKKLFTNSQEEYFYKFALETLVRADKKEIEAFNSNSFEQIYGVVLQMIYIDFCNIVFDSGFEFDYENLDPVFQNSDIFTLYDYFFTEDIMDMIDDIDDETDDTIDEDIAEYVYEGLYDHKNRLEELFANYRPHVTEVLCSKHSTMKLLYMMYYANQEKIVLTENGEVNEEFTGYRDYIAYVNACIEDQTIDNVQAYSWIEEKMP